MNDISKEGTWVWKGGEQSNFRSWITGQPDSAAANEDCAYYWAEKGSKWNDWTCEGKATHYACSIPLGTFPTFPNSIEDLRRGVIRYAPRT